MQELPKPPTTLSVASKRLWTSILKEFRIEDPPGQATLKTALEALDRANQLKGIIDKDGPVFTDRYGQPRAHPLLSEERGARSAFLSGLKQLELELPKTPATIGRPLGS